VIDWKKRAKLAEALLERYVRQHVSAWGQRDQFCEDARFLLIDADTEDARYFADIVEADTKEGML
jgi:hypothetical protein